MSVPLVDLHAQHASIADDLDAAVADVLASGAFVGGPAVGAFEEEYATWVGAAFAVGVANGTDAVELGLRAAGVEPGDEVLVPAATFIATAEAVVAAGATPVFVDVDPITHTMDAAAATAAISPRTTSMVPVHLYGRLADMAALGSLAASHGLQVIEDTSQAHGARRDGRTAGTFGTAGTFSFYPSKNLGAAGDAGAIVTDDAAIASRARELANHGGLRKDEHVIVGRNSRLDTIQAAVLRLKLPHIDAWNARRRDHAAAYAAALNDIPGISLPDLGSEGDHVWHVYVVQVADGARDQLRDHLTKMGIGTGVHYPLPVHLTPAFEAFGTGPGSCPIAEELSREALSLPMFPELTPAQIDEVAAAIRAFAR